jgi:hypothetical protein
VGHPDSLRTLATPISRLAADTVKTRTTEESKIEGKIVNLESLDHSYTEMPSVGQVAKGWLIFVGIALAILGLLWR